MHALLLLCWLAPVVLILPALAGCASLGLPIIGTDQNLAGRQIADRSANEAAGKIEKSVGAKIDQSRRQTVNDVVPWLVAWVVVCLAGCAVIVYWIRRNSYLRQKPEWEARRLLGIGGKV